MRQPAVLPLAPTLALTLSQTLTLTLTLALTLTLTLTPTRCDNPQFFVGLAEPPTSKKKKFYPPEPKPEEVPRST